MRNKEKFYGNVTLLALRLLFMLDHTNHRRSDGQALIHTKKLVALEITTTPKAN